MLGLDLLDGGRLTFDFHRQTLTIDERRDLPGDGDEIALKAHRRDGQLTLVDADIAGIKVTAFLDCGAQDTIGNMALRDLAITRYPLTPFRPIPIVSVTGQTIDAEFADLPGLRIGGLLAAELAGRLRRPAHLQALGPGRPPGDPDRRRHPQPVRDRLPRLPPRRGAPAPAGARLKNRALGGLFLRDGPGETKAAPDLETAASGHPEPRGGASKRRSVLQQAVHVLDGFEELLLEVLHHLAGASGRCRSGRRPGRRSR